MYMYINRHFQSFLHLLYQYQQWKLIQITKSSTKAMGSSHYEMVSCWMPVDPWYVPLCWSNAIMSLLTWLLSSFLRLLFLLVSYISPPYLQLTKCLCYSFLFRRLCFKILPLSSTRYQIYSRYFACSVTCNECCRHLWMLQGRCLAQKDLDYLTDIACHA